MHRIIRKRSKLGNTYYVVVNDQNKLVDFFMKRIEAGRLVGRLDNTEVPDQPEEETS
jgi:hypothetical protein